MWRAALSPDKPKVARKPMAARKQKQPKTSKPRKALNTVRDEVVKLLSPAALR
jgi:hypothetical protein